MSKKMMKNFKNRLTWVDGLRAFFPKKQGKNCQGNGQKLPQEIKAKKRDSPGPSPDQFILAVVGTIFVIVGAFVFVWYTALKRNL